ncbi:penicillin-binding transpeptidase domain-containing protein [Aneurinibacillus sp. Ricciae_BoGa-3]|uniref:peptidoglycan D,D-transpeptidase FtsI family protein n=1 Tax=Aneurinibacillus sp. Ricciae_BoGa-3 TaxID=3022697 RepID=UPI00233FD42E|nr:penicillin-binding transpeptidase domain-containing protein [Aneurinibacillus sp. Ricciae_BoGa-3]WCK53582.1 penicillin-binding transpeptidase domain-containing protein [Aneurinibacillus sp. Ricciae_BoGa-3]
MEVTRTETKRKKRRVLLVLLLVTFLFVGLLSRLAWIQVFSTRSFSSHHVDLLERAVAQRREKLVLDTGRGMIYDRNGKPLTGEEYTGLAVFPFARYGLEQQDKVQKLASILGVDSQIIKPTVISMKHADFWNEPNGKRLMLNPAQVQSIHNLDFPGIMPLTVTERVPEGSVAHHVIGFIAQNPELIKKQFQDELKNGMLTTTSRVGVTGLERTFQSFLGGIGEKSVSFYVDGRGTPLGGLDIRMQEPHNSYFPLSVTTTLDRDMQQKMEQAFDRSPVKTGAAVVLDVKTREVLAMVSRPDYNPNQPNQAGSSAWENQALKQMTPGSIFKVVVAAAALQEGLFKPTDKFVCKGEYGKYGFSCWKKGGHGVISLEDAFADSCNITFGEVAAKLGRDKIQQYGKKLGLTQQIGWEKTPFFKMGTFKQFDRENNGQVFAPTTTSNDEGMLMQTGIGQRDVQVTPLQAANMAATIADDGKKEKVRIVQSINYQNGTSFYRFEDSPLDGADISSQTAQTLRRFMERVVDDGTGMSLKQSKWPIAGKSGTAQTLVNTRQKNNQWFIGYTPRDNPKYAIAVVAEQQPTTGINQATKIFGDYVNSLAEAQAKAVKSK